MKKYIYIIISAMFLLFSNCSGNNDSPKKPIVHNGIIDIEKWDFEKDGPLDLKGNWEFYWKKLLLPNELDKHKPKYIKVPQYWHKQFLDNQKLPNQGYATYRLKIKSPTMQRLFLYFHPPDSSNKFFFNGELLKFDGKPAENYEKEVMGKVIEIIQLDLKKVNNLVIQTSSYVKTRPGIGNSIIIGTKKDINNLFQKRNARDVFLFGALFVIFIYNLFHYFFRRKKNASLWLALFTLNFAFRVIFTNQRMVNYIFDNISFETFTRLEILTIALGISLILKFLDSLYEEVVHKSIKLIFYMTSISYGIIIIFFPLKIVYHYLFHVQIAIILGGIYLIYILLLCTYKKKEGALISLIGFILLCSTVLIDILVVWSIISSIMLVPFGVLIFFIFQSFNLLHNFFKTYTKIEKFSTVLENTVKMRSQELYDERNELKKRNDMMNNELDLAKKIQQQLIPLVEPTKNISFLYKPMEKVGGDYFEFLKFRDTNQLGVFISDVSGHGVPAAFITSMIKTMILQAGNKRNNPAELLYYLNDLLINQTAGNFITAFYAIINTQTREIHYSNAGHNAPFIISKDSITMLEGQKTVPLSIMDTNTLEKNKKPLVNHKITLKEKDKMIFYTDGLTEATNIDDKKYVFFEDEKLIQLLESSYELNCYELKDRIYKELLEFRGDDNFDDDICLICVDF